MSGGIQEALLRVHEFDRGMGIDVDVHESKNPDGFLFGDIPADQPIHPSYEATFELCQKFNPYNRSDSEVSDEDIDTYLSSLIETGPIQEAFFVTGRDSLDDLKKAWFRRGRGFEHVICGEGGKGTKLGGYHFWYMHYKYERDGRAKYTGANYGKGNDQGGMADKRIVTGGMWMDPDGPGGKKPLRKSPKGGFTTGHSVSAFLAAGHIAFYGGSRVRGADLGGMGTEESPTRAGFKANLNGKTYDWTFHRMSADGGSSIRTFWPKWRPGN